MRYLSLLSLVASFPFLPKSSAFRVGPLPGKVSNTKGTLPVSTLTSDFVGSNADVLLPPDEIGQFDDKPMIDYNFSPDLYMEEERSSLDNGQVSSFLDYGSFAKSFPMVNNMMIASGKAALADFFAQTVIAQTGLDAVDWHRTFLFCLFGAFYQGGFQYLYQVNIFSKLFDNVEQFTSQPWADKVKDGPGLRSLALQVLLDLLIMSSIALPTYYTFKASVFSGAMDPALWLQDGLTSYGSHFGRDETDLLRVWIPADILCFSVPLILRLPVRQVISLFYTAYLSSASF